MAKKKGTEKIGKRYIKSVGKKRSMQRVLRGTGYVFDSFNGRSVGVVGDGRVYAPVAIMRAKGRISIKKAGELSTRIINETPGISRVMIEIPTPKAKKRLR
jgi:GMP synthase PP-ATPase subunit